MRFPVGRLHDVIRRFGYEVTPRPFTRLLRAIRPDLVVDIGANEGQFGQELRRYRYRGRIVSFEPYRKAFERLQEVAASDPLWSVRNEAVGAEEGEASIHVSAFHATNSLLPPGAAFDRYVDDVEFVGVEPVSVRRLDAVFDDLHRPGERVVLKVDTQGFERAVLEGAGAVLDEVEAIFLELSFVPLYDGEAPMETVVGLLRERGFVPAYLTPAFTEAGTRRWIQADVLFIREPAG